MENFKLDDKVVIITGASKGIGEAIALLYVFAGAKVVVSSRSQEAVSEVANKINMNGGEALGIACNMGKPEEVENLVKKTIQHYGSIDVIVNNAATNPVFGPIHETSMEAFDKIMNVNVKGPFNLCKQAYPEMVRRGGGSIINISSIGGLSPEHMLGIYSVSKAALISLTKVFAKEWGKDGIRANVICPGLIKTKFSEPLWNNDKILQSAIQQLSIPRIGEPAEIADLALFLASEASSYCTGAVFTADGGYTI